VNRCCSTRLLQQSDVWHVHQESVSPAGHPEHLARAVCSAPWSTSATELRRSLHWLPVQLQDGADRIPGSSDWSSGVHHVTAARQRSTTPPSIHGKLLLQSPFCLLTLRNRAFSISAPQVWNTLSLHCRASPSTDSFKHRLKAELFNTAYPV